MLTPRNGIGLLAAVVVVAIVASALPSPHPQTTAEPTGRPVPTASPNPSEPPAEAWGELTLPAWEPMAELRPVDVDASGVAVTSAFILRSRTTASAAALAVGLAAEPPVAFEVEPGATAAEVTIVPAEILVEGIVYRFRLTDPSGALAGSWAYRTERPLHVVSTVPGDQTTAVPLNTGIEIEFDQDGVADISDQFSIEPPVAGRFEAHGRTVVFVPTTPLAAAAIYRVTIAAGVAMSGSDQVLEAPVTFAFETAPAAGGDAGWDVGLGRPILEASPGEAPIIGVDVVQPDSATPLAGLPFEVYRLPTFAAARAAAVTLSAEEGWGQWAASDLVPTTGLARVAAFDSTFESSSPYGYRVVRFPEALAAGWYLVVVPREGRDRQVLLQVTTLAAFALTSETRTIGWVNDTATGEPVAGAALTDPSGAEIGTTAANGLLDTPTPASLRDSAAGAGSVEVSTAIVTVTAPDGRRLLLALGLRSRTRAYQSERNDSSYRSAERRWWLLISTDRTTYRSSDTVHAWGLIRSRLDGSVPGALEATLRAPNTSSEVGPWLARVPVIATSRGTWTADLPIDQLPLGGYIVELHAAGEIAASTWVAVDEIRKPAYRIEVATDAEAYIAGQPVAISGQAAFFDGTAAAGLNLRIEAFGDSRIVTTDTDGRIGLTLPARTSVSYLDYTSISIQPESPEEGEIVGYKGIFVLPSSAWITASGTIAGSRLVVSGTLSQADLERVERDIASTGWPEDPSGAPIGGRTVTIRVVENVATKKQIGTTYDYIEKVVIPLYDYSYVEKAIGTYTTTSGPDGAISLSVPITNPDSGYAVTLTARDGEGRTATADPYVSPRDGGTADGGAPLPPYLEQPGSCGYYREEHDVGDAIDLTMREGDGSPSSGGRYLFVVAGQGIRDALVQDTPAIHRPYREADLAGLGIFAVRFEDGAYVVTNEVHIQTKLDGRTLNVELEADRSRYAPGGQARVAVRITDPDGDGVAADVVLRAVDEKLYEIDGAGDIGALDSLLMPLGDGLLRSYASHPLPTHDDEGCGDTSGGDGRDDFRDSALFEVISTGSDGRGSVQFALPDDLTSWHVSATALAGDLRAGDGNLLLPVGLPFFADAIIASDLLVGERPILRVRSFGDELAPDDRVRYTISAPSLLLPATTVEADAFATATLELPDLAPGVHAVTIAATVVGDSARKDTLVRKIVVRWSRLEVATTELTTPGAAGSVGGSGLTTYVVTDAGRGSLLPLLEDLAYGGGARFDRQLAADIARDLLVSTFGVDETGLPTVDFDPARYQRGGVAPLPYSSTELALTAMTAIVAPERLRAEDARAALGEWMVDASVTRERAIIAVAGLAGLGNDVLTELHAIDVEAITIREALWVALGLVAAGDEDGARTIERALLEAHGQVLGPWVRLDVGGSLASTLDAASLLALVATGIGDPLAPSVARYVREMTTREALYVLPEIGVIRWSLDRLPRAAASFAWTVDGARHEERLAPGASWSTSLTPRQRDGFRIETLGGSLAVVATWTRTPGPDDLPSGGLVTISRTVTPAGTAPAIGVVRVQLEVVFASDAPTGCWDVSDRLPSGLVPFVNVPGWADDEAGGRNMLWPYEIAGQRVSWCLDPSDGREQLLGYAARVVSGGTFTWEPAVVQSVAAPEVGATTPVTTYTIR
jgi:hypothetical protein